jgi:GNAT superfamily N-acetyltransferase
VEILSSRTLELPAERREQLTAAAHAEFAQFDLVREIQWANPDWSYLAFDGGELAGFFNLIERNVAIDGVDARVAGLNNLVTMPAQRGRGVASRLLRETQPQWFDALGAECGLLLCADALLPFYSRLSWQRVEARVTFAQAGGARVWPANCMVLGSSLDAAAIREIDLCGLPW